MVRGLLGVGACSANATDDRESGRHVCCSGKSVGCVVNSCSRVRCIWTHWRQLEAFLGVLWIHRLPRLQAKQEQTGVGVLLQGAWKNMHTAYSLLRSTKSGPDSRENPVFLPPTSPHEYSGNMTTFLKGGHPSPWASLDSKQGKRASKIFFAWYIAPYWNYVIDFLYLSVGCLYFFADLRQNLHRLLSHILPFTIKSLCSNPCMPSSLAVRVTNPAHDDTAWRDTNNVLDA